jgi:acetyltransferase-like isoleucine patch superfamily enzyme
MAALGARLPDDRIGLARATTRGWISPDAVLAHPGLRLGPSVFVDDGARIVADREGGGVELGARVIVGRDVDIRTGRGGRLVVGADSSIEPGCRLLAYVGPVRIGRDTKLGPACALYPFAHGTARGEPFRTQDWTTKGGIVVGDDVWLGHGVVVLDGVTVGDGAVVGAGSVVTADVPAMAIAAGTPARVIGSR